MTDKNNELIKYPSTNLNRKIDNSYEMLIEDCTQAKFKRDNQLEKNKNKEKVVEYYRRNQFEVNRKSDEREGINESESESDNQLDDPMSKSSLDDDNYSTSSYSPSSQDNDSNSDNRFFKNKFNDNFINKNRYSNKKNQINSHAKDHKSTFDNDLNNLKITFKNNRDQFKNDRDNYKTNQKVKIKFHNEANEGDEEMTSSSSINSLEASNEMEDQFMESMPALITPEFLKNRIQFANQVLITQIKDKNTIVTFKESLLGTFPKL